MSPLLHFLSKLIKAPKGKLGYLTVLFPYDEITCHFIPVSPPRALILQAAAFLKEVICQHKMEGPCRQISSLLVRSFCLDKENHWDLHVVCVCVLRLWLLFEPKLERILNLREIGWESTCWSCPSMCLVSWGWLKHLGRKSPLRRVWNLDLLLYLCIFYFNLLRSPWEEEWWFSPERLFGPLELGMV